MSKIGCPAIGLVDVPEIILHVIGSSIMSKESNIALEDRIS